MNDSKWRRRWDAIYGVSPSDEWMAQSCPWRRQLDEQEAAEQRQAEQLVHETEDFLKAQQ